MSCIEVLVFLVGRNRSEQLQSIVTFAPQLELASQTERCLQYVAVNALDGQKLGKG